MKDEVQRKTIDKGWQAMSQVLEKEMPQQKKRRLALWWLLFIGMPFIVWTIWKQHQSQPDRLPQEKQQPAPLVNNDGRALPLVQQQPINHRVIELPQSKFQAKSAQTSIKPTRPGLESGTVQEDHSTAVENAALPRLTQSNPDSMKEVIQKSIPELVQPVDLLSFISNEIPFVSSGQEKPFSKLVSLFIQPSPEQKRNKHWSLGLTASAQTEKFSRLDSYDAGIAIEWQPFPKLGIRSGLSYARHPRVQASTSKVVLDAENYLKTADTSNFIIIDQVTNEVVDAKEYTVNALPNYVSIPVRYYEQLAVPVLLNWKCRKFLNLHFGGSIGYITRLKTARIGESGKWTISPSNDETYSQVEKLAIKEISRWKYDIRAGLAVPLNRHLEVSFGIKLPFTIGKNTSSSRLFTPNGIYNGDPNNITNLRTSPLFNMGFTCFL